MASIRQQGLLKGTRQHVHLSADRETATQVGARRDKPIIFTIAATRMHQSGHEFYLSKNGSSAVFVGKYSGNIAVVVSGLALRSGSAKGLPPLPPRRRLELQLG